MVWEGIKHHGTAVKTNQADIEQWIKLRVDL